MNTETENKRQGSPASVAAPAAMSAAVRAAFRGIRLAQSLVDWRLRHEAPFRPDDPAVVARARLVVKISPPPDELDAAWRAVSAALDAPVATDDAVNEVVGLIFDSFPAFRPAERTGLIWSAAEALALEAEERRWPASVLAAGALKLIRTAKFPPTASEIIAACTDAADALEAAQIAIDRASSARLAAEALLAAVDAPTGPPFDPDRCPF